MIKKDAIPGLMLAVIFGGLGYWIAKLTKSPFADPLLISMVLGIVFRTVLEDTEKLSSGFAVGPAIFIPIGIAFYAAKNLNFVKAADMNPAVLVLLVVVVAVYFAVILLLGKYLGQKKEITYLTATGSAICGASAIAVTSPAVGAEPDDISISLLSVTVAALTAFFIFLPFLSILLKLSDREFAMMSGSILQFTGFVKASVVDIPFLVVDMEPKKLASLATSIKAMRYLGLLIAIPLFASMAKGKISFPWVLWVFLLAGIAGSLIYKVDSTFYTKTLVPVIKPIYNVSWSMAMAAIGLNADAKKLLSNNGTKALIMAFAGFIFATAAFLYGLMYLQ